MTVMTERIELPVADGTALPAYRAGSPEPPFQGNGNGGGNGQGTG